jgi:hypothetical protein
MIYQLCFLLKVGPRRCMIVYYEQLVLHPRRWITIILDFLDLPFDESVMHHQVQLSRKIRIFFLETVAVNKTMNVRKIAIFVLIQYVKTKNSRFTAKMFCAI